MNVHNFENTVEAYDECMCNEEINIGDIIHIESEKVVGLSDVYPIAVTIDTGELHSLNEGCLELFLKESDITPAQIKAAVDYAITLGYAINPVFTVEDNKPTIVDKLQAVVGKEYNVVIEAQLNDKLYIKIAKIHYVCEQDWLCLTYHNNSLRIDAHPVGSAIPRLLDAIL